MKMKYFGGKITEEYFISIAFYNVFRTRFWLSTFLSFLVGKLDIAQVENRVQKTLQNPTKCKHFLVIWVKKCSADLLIHSVSRTRFWLYIFLQFHCNQLTFSQFGNRVLKVLENTMNGKYFSVILPDWSICTSCHIGTNYELYWEYLTLFNNWYSI